VLYQPEARKRSQLITFTSDFGTRDGYVAIVKGVICSLNPNARVIDLSHEVEPWNVSEAAWIIYNAYKFFPKGTVHLVVVDPEVGSAQRRLLLSDGHHFFVGPDSGVFTHLIRDPSGGIYDGESTARERRWDAFELTESSYWLPTLSTSFHARDLFGPVAAHLANGESLDSFGKRLDVNSLNYLPVSVLEQSNGQLSGEILYIDRFGNLITNIPSNMVPDESICFVKDACVGELATTYSIKKSADAVAFRGSHGFVEVAVYQGRANLNLDASTRDRVRIEFPKRSS
jgi:S-adenosyl-L-methionine hydrolase (adenosine-forming)